MKKATSPNPNHPKTRLIVFRQTLKEYYRKQTTLALKMLVNEELKKVGKGPLLPTHPVTHRHEMMCFLMETAIAMWKVEWKLRYGWDYDDVNNEQKLHGHLAKMQMAAEQHALENVPPPHDTSVIRDIDGKVYTKEEFQQLPGEQQANIRTFMMMHVQQIVKAGYAGVLGGGMIVDRRLQPTAIPMQRNIMLGIPAPRDLPNANAPAEPASVAAPAS